MAEMIANWGTLPPALMDGRSSIAESVFRFGYDNIADQAGVSRQTVSAFMHGKTASSPKTRRRLQRAIQTLKVQDELDGPAILASARAMIAEGKITLCEMARRVGEDPSNLSKMLTGKRGISKKALLALGDLAIRFGRPHQQKIVPRCQ